MAPKKSQNTKGRNPVPVPGKIGKTKTRRRAPLKPSPAGWTEMYKDELVTAVNGSVGLTALQFPINPGLSVTFPIGATEARRMTEWQCDEIEFRFERTVSEFATQGTTGRIVIACDYSAINDAPQTLQAAEALHSVKGMPSDRDHIRLRLIPNLVNKADPKYIRTGTPPASSDIRLYDGGNLWFVVSGCQDTSEIGELHVRYRFRLRLPNLDDTARLSATSLSMFNLSANTQFTTGVLTTVPFDEAVVNAYEIVNTAGSFVPPAGTYLVRAEISAVDSSSEQFNGDVRVYADGAALTPPATTQFLEAAIASGKTNLVVSGYVVCDGTTAVTIKLVLSGAAGTLSALGDNCRVLFQLV